MMKANTITTLIGSLLCFAGSNSAFLAQENKPLTPALGELLRPEDSPAAQKSKGGTPVVYHVEGTNVSARLYYPPNYSKDARYKAVVVVAPQGGLKEQTAGIYAKKLAQQGFVALAFDHRTYGESGGAPRQYESPQWKSEDIKGAISYISTVGGVDKNAIAVLAICSGAGYGLMASVNDYRVKALATVSGVFNFRERETGLSAANKPTKEQVSTFRDKMKKSAEARQKYFETGIMEYTPLVPDLTPDTSYFWQQGYDYYRTKRGFINGWENKRSAHSFEARLSTNATDYYAKQLTNLGTPLLAIAGDKAFSYPFSVRVIEQADKMGELHSIKGVTHFDLYDKDEYVDQAIKQLTNFFNTHIK